MMKFIICLKDDSCFYFSISKNMEIYELKNGYGGQNNLDHKVQADLGKKIFKWVQDHKHIHLIWG